MKRRQRGGFLLEALVALVVFSLASIALLGVVAQALRQGGSARWRAETAGIASSAVSLMWAEDPAALASSYDSAAPGPGYRELLAAAMRLPGVATGRNEPRVNIVDLPDGRRVSVTVFWQLTGDLATHRAVVSGTLPPVL